MLKDISAKIPAYADILYDVLSFVGGMNSRTSELFMSRDAKFSLRKDEAPLIVNMVRTKSGLLTTRPGRVKLNASAIVPAAGSDDVLSLFELRPANGNDSVLATAGNGIFKYITGSFVSQGTTATNNKRFHWCQFKDKALGINGTDAMVSYDGTALGTVAAAPVDGTAILSHRNRVWIIRGKTLSYCALGDETDWTTTNNAGSVPIPVTRGIGGTAMISLWDRLIVTSGQQVFQLLGTSATDFVLSPVNLIYGHTGTPEAFIAAGNDIYYVNKRGIHSLSVVFAQSVTGDVSTGYASSKVEPTWQSLHESNLPNVVGVHDSIRNMMLFLCSRGGAPNTEAFAGDYLHLDEQGSPTWSLFDNMPFASALEVQSLSSKPEVLFGGYDGFVYKQTNDETDVGSTIPVQLQYRTDLELPAFSKLWRHMLLFASGQDTTLSGNIVFDFGRQSIPFTVDLDVEGGDIIGTTFTIGQSVLGVPALKEVRVSVPGHGRFATITMSASSLHRVTIGGFIIYAGVRRTAFQ